MKSIRSLQIVGLVMLFSTAASYAKLPKPEPSNQGPLPLKVHEMELEVFGQERPDWGLALSGGGLRSASFAFGALKRLYDDRILDRISIISSVSGGGYTAYEMYLNDLDAGNGARFGSATFADEVFTGRMFEHALTGNFVTYGQVIRTAFLRQKSINLYEASLHRTFGGAEPTEGFTTLQALAGSQRASRLPYLVVNTTFVRPTPTGYADGAMEFTPILVGNTRRGLHPLVEPFELRRAIAISGAAFAPFLKQDLSDPTGVDGTITLSDGGHSENLGAFALIRRGVKNIIIIDAEHDPSYEFGAYVSLRDRLKQWGSNVWIQGIEDIVHPESGRSMRKALAKGARAANALYIGGVNSTAGDGQEVTTKIYYLKLSLSENTDAEVASDGRLSRGEQIDKDTFLFLKSHSRADGSWDSSLLNDRNIDVAAWLAHYVANAPQSINRLWRVKLLRLLPWNFQKINFPHYSTGDQSFYLNQSLAFIGLGYFSAKEIKPAVESQEGQTKGTD